MADSNSFITASWVARKGLTILHDKAKAAVRCNRNYEGLFGKPLAGVPLGTSIQVRLPFKYTLRTGAFMSANPLVQRTSTLNLNNQNGVDLDLTSVERQMDIGDFSEQILTPAMTQISGGIEQNICALANSIPAYTGVTSTTVSFAAVLLARQYLTQMLVPDDGDFRSLLVCPQHNYDWVVNNAALYNPQELISDQFIEGIIATRVASFLAFEETKLANYTAGTYTGTSIVVKAGTTPGTTGTGNTYASTVTLSTTNWQSADFLNAGDVVTISGVYDCDPEMKFSLGRLKEFVVTAKVTDAGGEIDMVLSPGLIFNGAYQNVTQSTGVAFTSGASIAGNTVNIIFGTASNFNQSVAFGRDAILFANVPMQDVSEVVKFCAEESYDGFHLRVIQGYDINSDVLKTRLDNLSGEILAYPEMAVRVIGQ